MADEVSPRTEQRKRRQQRRRVALIGFVVVLLIVAAAGVFVATRDDSEQAAPKPPPTTAAIQNTDGISATYAAAPLRNAITKGGDVAVYASPDANAQPTQTLSAQTEYTLPRSFLVFDQYQDWLHVYLPIRPNDATGWIKASDVNVTPLDYQVKVSLAARKLWLMKDGVVQFDAPAAIGTDENPTPTGIFYYTDPLDLHNQPGTGYGVFAIGLSGHSNTLSEFAGGDGQIAVHGTNDPGTIGTPVSHGCVRVNNDVIMKLATLPLGTPVVIT